MLSDSQFTVRDAAETEWRVVLRSLDHRRLAEGEFVLTALGLPCLWGRGEQGQLLLMVPAASAAEALAHLVRYETEDAEDRHGGRTPAAGIAGPVHANRGGRLGALAYVAGLLAFAFAQTTYLGNHPWLEAGKLRAELVRDGEWWRTVTALTLHVDTAHLFGNLVFGVLFGFLLSLSLGSGAAWASIVLCGALGNLLNAWLQSPEHTSIGASTAVFAALGLLAAYQWRVQLRPGERWLRRFAPLGAGLALLALLGAGGERTDVGAHLTGFVCGLGAGWLWSSRLRVHGPPAPRWQWAMSGAALALVGVAWLVALGAY